MEELRLLHFADLHLGVETGGRTDPSTGLNQRVVDVCDRLDEVCATVERESVHAVIFAGDAFMNPRPSPTLQKLFASRIRRMVRSSAGVFLLIGNHDLPKMAGIAHPYAIYPALEVDGVIVGDKARVYKLPLPAGELQVAALPHFSRAEVTAQLESDIDTDEFIAEQVAARVRALGEEIDPSSPSVFAGHCHVTQAEVGEAQTLFGVSDVEVSLSTLTSGQPFPYYALGHVHGRQVLQDDPFVAYSGSLDRVDFGEGSRIDVARDGSVSHRESDPKGFYLVTMVRRADTWRLSKEPEFRAVDARRFITVRVGKVDPLAPLEDVAARVRRVREAGIEMADAFVRLDGTIDRADRARVTANAVRALIPEAYEVRLALDAHDAALVRDPRFAERMTELDALERYLSTREDWAADRDELMRLGRELAAEVL